MSLPQWLLLISTLLFVAVMLGLLANRVRLPLTVVLALVGFVATLIGRPLGFEMPLEGRGFEEVLVFVFLPVLVFSAALGLPTRVFLNNVGAILVLAVLALGVSAALVGVSLYFVLGIPLAAALLFGALISATDPVAVVAIFKKLGVPRRLLTLVEGESLLNDGLAIVLFNVLLLAALGQEVGVLEGVLDFFKVFIGGATIGCILGFLMSMVLPWLDRLAAAGLSLALAYGGFVLADYVLGLSGVMATVGAGLVIGGLSPSRASSAVRELWEQLWESLDYVANALLFLLIGISIEPALIFENAEAILLAVLVVCVARATAVLPLMSALERFTSIPPVGWHNEAVLIWGGLRGGVALALALSLPQALPQREVFVAMTGGVVLATLLLNATTISALVHRLGLDQASKPEKFLASFALISAIERSRRRLKELGFEDPEVLSRLSDVESETWKELENTELSEDEEIMVLTRQGLSVERITYQHLLDSGMLKPSVARSLLHEVGDQIEALEFGQNSMNEMESNRQHTSAADRLLHRILELLPRSNPEDHKELAYDEAGARRLGARRAREALESFRTLDAMDKSVLNEAQETFSRWEKDALDTLEELDPGPDDGSFSGLRHRRAEALSRLSATDALHELASKGLLPENVTKSALENLSAKIGKESPD